MRTYIDENGNKARANNYQEAAVKLYGQAKSISGGMTTNAWRRHGYADVSVWKAGDKIGTFWGVQADMPIKHILKIAK